MCDRAYRDGANILILSDRDIDEYHVAIPSPAGCGRGQQVSGPHPQAHRHGADSGKRRAAPDVHDFATLLGYGAAAINPYLAQETASVS